MSDAAALEQRGPGRWRLAGTLGFATAGDGLLRGEPLLAAAEPILELDVAGLAGVDSATLAVLLAWAARLAQQGRRLQLVGVPGELAALARLCEVEGLLGLA